MLTNGPRGSRLQLRSTSSSKVRDRYYKLHGAPSHLDVAATCYTRTCCMLITDYWSMHTRALMNGDLLSCETTGSGRGVAPQIGVDAASVTTTPRLLYLGAGRPRVDATCFGT